MEIKMKSVECAACHIVFAITEDFETSLRKCHNTFYCPQGHRQYFPQKSEEEKLREQLRKEKDRLASFERAQRNALVKRQEAAKKAAATRKAKKEGKK